MSRYMIICRLRWPAFLLLTGVIALLNQADILSWGRGWPLYLILWGVLALAERATLAAEPQPPAFGAGYPAASYAGQPGAPQPPYQPVYPQPYQQPYQQTVPSAPMAETPSTGIVPAHGGVDSLTKEPRKSWEEEGR